jgi:phenylalanyl-tRNA synthetase alpha chain
MSYKIVEIEEAAKVLVAQAENDGSGVMRAPELRALYERIKTLPAEERGAFGQEVNQLKKELESLIKRTQPNTQHLLPIDVSAPWDVNSIKHPEFLSTTLGSQHPLMTEMNYIIDIFYRMGFTAVESREIDDDYHMFTSLNFPAGHPARDDYDTFITDEGLIAPAHTSTMQNRVLQTYRDNLEAGEPIAAVIPGRVFRNEDIDVTHEHTFYQFEGVYVNKGVNVGNLVATLRAFMSEYFGQNLKAKIQPFYFPFTEPSFEFAIERPLSLRKGNTEADMWLELLGCGMIHPNVLKDSGIDPNIYTGFAWGCGIERLVLMKYGIEDIRHFESAKLEFLRQFK